MTLIGSVTALTAVAIFLGAFLIRALGGAASSILADEFKASAPETAQRIIRLAARRIPEHSRAEVLETWLAEASEYEGRPLKALRFALVNCLAAAPGLARQLRPALATAGGGTKEAGGVRRGSDLIRRDAARMVKELFRSAERSWRGSVRVIVASLGMSAGVLLRQGGETLRLFGEAFAELGRALVAVAREVVELLGPYDYSREWRSVLQLVVRMIAMIFAITLGFAAFFYVAEVVLGF
jgi:hypothetical protein